MNSSAIHVSSSTRRVTGAYSAKMRSRRAYDASRPTRSSKNQRIVRNTRRPSRTGTPRGTITVRTADISVATMTAAPATTARTRSAITPSPAHQLTRGLLDAAAERRIDGERLCELIDREARVDRERKRQDQVRGVRRDNRSSDDDVRRAERDDLHETVLQPDHLRARVRRERKASDLDR